ncbi:shikimate kinase [bacterium]|nr:shikimate kinase [bacterium]
MKTITLIGMMGSGKSTIGKLLADKLQISHIDIDSKIEVLENRTISEIFSAEDENYFRKIENKIIKDTFIPDNCIISTGGGAFENEDSRKFLLENSTVIFLETSAEIIFDRIKNNTERPLLNNNMTIEKIQEIIELREHNYKQAHIKIITDNKKPQEITKEILGAL